MGSNNREKVITFQNASTVIGNGAELIVNKNNMLMNIDFSGTSTSFDTIFEVLVFPDGVWKAVRCANLTTLAMNTNCTANDTMWQMSLEGISKARVRIISIANGDLTIRGAIVD